MSETPEGPVPESVPDLVRRTIRHLDGVRLVAEEKAHVRPSRMKTLLESTEEARHAALGDAKHESDLSREAALAALKLTQGGAPTE